MNFGSCGTGFFLSLFPRFVDVPNLHGALGTSPQGSSSIPSPHRWQRKPDVLVPQSVLLRKGRNGRAASAWGRFPLRPTGDHRARNQWAAHAVFFRVPASVPARDWETDLDRTCHGTVFCALVEKFRAEPNAHHRRVELRGHFLTEASISQQLYSISLPLHYLTSMLLAVACLTNGHLAIHYLDSCFNTLQGL